MNRFHKSNLAFVFKTDEDLPTVMYESMKCAKVCFTEKECWKNPLHNVFHSLITIGN